MPYNRRYHRLNYQSLLNENSSKQNRVLSLLEALKKGEDPDIAIGNLDKNKAQVKPVAKEPIEENIQTESDQTETTIATQIPNIVITSAEECPGFYAKTDIDLSDANNFLTGALYFIDIAKHAGEKLRICKDRITEEDRIIQDLLHEIRQPLKSEQDALALYKLLHRAERRRQDFKNLAEPLALIANYVSAHQPVFDGFIPIIKLAQQRVNNQSSWVYMQKSSSLKLPIGDAYRQLPKQEQDKIKATYEMNKKKDKYSYNV